MRYTINRGRSTQNDTAGDRGNAHKYVDLDQGLPLSVPAPLGMNSPDEKQGKEESIPPRASDFRRMLEAYAAELQAIIDKLRRKLN